MPLELARVRRVQGLPTNMSGNTCQSHGTYNINSNVSIDDATSPNRSSARCPIYNQRETIPGTRQGQIEVKSVHVWYKVSSAKPDIKSFKRSVWLCPRIYGIPPCVSRVQAANNRPAYAYNQGYRREKAARAGGVWGNSPVLPVLYTPPTPSSHLVKQGGHMHQAPPTLLSYEPKRPFPAAPCLWGC